MSERFSEVDRTLVVRVRSVVAVPGGKPDRRSSID